jgi:hypothetical protein
MAVLKGNVVVRTDGGEVVTLLAGTDREMVESAGYGVEAQRVLDNPGHWVDALPDTEGDAPTNLLDPEERTIRPRPASQTRKPRQRLRNGQAEEDGDDTPKGRRAAPKGVVEAD